MKEYLSMKIDNQKTYIRMIKRTFRHAMFGIVTTVVLGILCYVLNNMYCTGVMVMASIYIVFFMVEHVIEIKHHQKLLEIWEGADWQKEINDAKKMYDDQARQYEFLIRRQEEKENQCT